MAKLQQRQEKEIAQMMEQERQLAELHNRH
jgi:hypothetical protein